MAKVCLQSLVGGPIRARGDNKLVCSVLSFRFCRTFLIRIQKGGESCFFKNQLKIEIAPQFSPYPMHIYAFAFQS